MKILESFANLFAWSKPVEQAMIDPTVYRVDTAGRTYCGVIIHQDDVVIKLKGFKPKPVKILKSNIERITIAKTESALQYYEWQKSRIGVGIYNRQFA